MNHNIEELKMLMHSEGTAIRGLLIGRDESSNQKDKERNTTGPFFNKVLSDYYILLLEFRRPKLAKSPPAS